MDYIGISKILKGTYYRQLLASVFLVVVAYLLKYFHQLDSVQVPGRAFNVVVATLAGVFGIALPIFYRSYFVYKIRNRKQISLDTFIRFERVLLTTALVTPYFLVVSLLLNMMEATNILITLFAIYAAYYYFPSGKKVLFEMKIFRLLPAKKKED